MKHARHVVSRFRLLFCARGHKYKSGSSNVEVLIFFLTCNEEDVIAPECIFSIFFFLSLCFINKPRDFHYKEAFVFVEAL